MNQSKKSQKNVNLGKDIPFERIRRILAIWWAPWTNGTMPKERKNGTGLSTCEPDIASGRVGTGQHCGWAGTSVHRLFPGLYPPLPRLPQPGNLAFGGRHTPFPRHADGTGRKKSPLPGDYPFWG